MNGLGDSGAAPPSGSGRQPSRVSEFVVALFLLFTAAAHADPIPPTPFPGASRAIGSPANGCLSGAQSLPLSGPGWEVLRPARNRFWGTPELLGFLRDVGARVAPWGRLRIGDLSQPRGGKMAYGHGSHQTGIDVDIFYGLPGQPLSEAERADPSTPSLLAADGRLDRMRWPLHQTDLLTLIAQDPRTDRIFVNPAIKRALCDEAGADRAWLHKLRPWPGHDDHFHIRILCPAGEGDCLPTPPIPAGDGCGSDLDWWFSLAARHPQPQPPAPKPPLPAACREILGTP